jgi:hypothetical protein
MSYTVMAFLSATIEFVFLNEPTACHAGIPGRIGMPKKFTLKGARVLLSRTNTICIPNICETRSG